MCSSMPVPKSSSWPRHSRSISLQSSSWFLRAGCHLHQAGFYSFLRVFPDSCVSQLYCFVLCFVFKTGQDGPASPPLHFQFLFHYLKITFASWVWATLSSALPVAAMFPILQLDVDELFVLLDSQQIRMNPVGYTRAYRTGTSFPLFLSPAPPRNWVLLAFLPFVAFPFPTTSAASPKLGQASRLSLLFSTCCLHSWPGRDSWFTEQPQSPWVLSMLFPLWSGWHWSCALLLFPGVLHPWICPSSFPALACQLTAALGAGSECCRVEAVLWLSLGGKVGGREGAMPCCRWGRLLVQAVLVGPTAAHQTCSLAFPRPKGLVLVLPETSLPYASDLEFPLSLYSWGVASLRATMALSGDQCHGFFASQRLN